jgi:hypothetical protein
MCDDEVVILNLYVINMCVCDYLWKSRFISCPRVCDLAMYGMLLCMCPILGI